MQPFINIEHLEKKIDDFTLGPIDFLIEPGTITALVGDNGSGKSTLLKIIMDLVNADKGQIDRFGLLEKEGDWKKDLAYQPQTVVGYGAFTGEDLHQLISHWYPTWDEKLFLHIINELHVPLNKKFSKLSQGVQQKLTLALTLPRNAKVLMLDEPTSFMDIPSKKIVVDLLVDWMEKEERAIILASHQAEDIKKLADFIVLLRSGKMLGLFEKESLTEKYRKYWVTGLPGFETIPGEVFRAEHEVISNQPDLSEQYFAAHDITPMNSMTPDLEEMITLILANKMDM
ncbi:ATP-binding cassette domain-containing protein [Pseudogracilibacillus auburnensis]|uniref:ATP-binding cassette domain-containing protein n=1 Tax=Pseudogracilibacillus auburnensis TaxID=1494959 RepID=UPI001A9602D1|nr:ABC transporter ATP-binding protein [Pseudogracilibacillus auburnensis]MBO1002178.1 ABC transporter ATP-binding protein [Pseudogracilibacillus auburnensis]